MASSSGKQIFPVRNFRHLSSVEAFGKAGWITNCSISGQYGGSLVIVHSGFRINQINLLCHISTRQQAATFTANIGQFETEVVRQFTTNGEIDQVGVGADYPIVDGIGDDELVGCWSDGKTTGWCRWDDW